MRIALFTGNYNYVREGANQALNRLVAHGLRHGHDFRIYSPVTDTPAFEPAGELVPVPSFALPVRSEFRLAPGLPRHDSRRRGALCARHRPCLDARHPRHARADLRQAARRSDRRQPAHALRDLFRAITAWAGLGRWPKRICAASIAAAIMCSPRRRASSRRCGRCAATIASACGAAASTASCSPRSARSRVAPGPGLAR